MSVHAARLARLFTREYVSRINEQIVSPSPSVLVNPDALEAALARPVTMSIHEPQVHTASFAAALSYHIITGRPFLRGNKRTAFFIANEYIRAQGIPGLSDNGKVGPVYENIAKLADRIVGSDSL